MACWHAGKITAELGTGLHPAPSTPLSNTRTRNQHHHNCIHINHTHAKSRDTNAKNRSNKQGELASSTRRQLGCARRCCCQTFRDRTVIMTFVILIIAAANTVREKGIPLRSEERAWIGNGKWRKSTNKKNKTTDASG